MYDTELLQNLGRNLGLTRSELLVLAQPTDITSRFAQLRLLDAARASVVRDVPSISTPNEAAQQRLNRDVPDIPENIIRSVN